MGDVVNTNISLEREFWKRCKKAAIDRGISLNQLVKNGLNLALDGDDVVKVDSKGKVKNDLKGRFKR